MIATAAAAAAIIDTIDRLRGAKKQAQNMIELLEPGKAVADANSQLNITLNKFSNNNSQFQQDLLDKLETLKASLNNLKDEVKGIGDNSLVESIKQHVNPDIFKQINSYTSDAEILAEINNFMGVESQESGSVDSVVELGNEIHKAGIDSILDAFKGGYDQFYVYLNSLSDIQAVAFSHILVFVVIYLLLLNICAVLLGNLAIEYFKIEERYPRLSKWLSYRKKFLTYYIGLYSFLTIFLISLCLFMDILVLLYK